MNKEILKLPPEHARDIVAGWYRDEYKIISKNIYDTSRWCLKYIIVVQRLSDGKFFKSFYEEGATELQDQEPYQYKKEAIFTEVFPVEKTITVYE